MSGYIAGNPFGKHEWYHLHTLVKFSYTQYLAKQAHLGNWMQNFGNGERTHGPTYHFSIVCAKHVKCWYARFAHQNYVTHSSSMHWIAELHTFSAIGHSGIVHLHSPSELKSGELCTQLHTPISLSNRVIPLLPVNHKIRYHLHWMPFFSFVIIMSYWTWPTGTAIALCNTIVCSKFSGVATQSNYDAAKNTCDCGSIKAKFRNCYN